MKRFKFLSCVLMLSLLIAGCQVFPYALESVLGTPTEEPFVTEPSQPTETAPLPTSTKVATPTITATSTMEEPIVEPTPESMLQFTIQEGSPMLLSNFANPSAGCHWMGVAGQVFDGENDENQALTIVAGKLSDDGDQEWSSVTGTALAYGPGGYEIQLSDTPVESSQTYWIEVHTQDGALLSDRFFFNTYEDCERNLILINFVPVLSSDNEKTEPTLQPTPTLEAYP